MASRLQILGRHFNAKEIKSNKPLNVTVTGAAGNIGYALVFMIGQGRMFGPTQPVNLTLLEIPQAEKALNGVVMELHDCAFPLLTSVKGVTDYRTGFTGCELAVLVGAKPRGPGMQRADLLGANAQIFKGQGKALNDFADKNVKVIVVGNPANTNAMICSHFAPNIPKENFTALTRLDENRAKAQISLRLKTGVENVQNLPIWGNHSLTQYPDVTQGSVLGDKKTSIEDSVKDQKWLQGEFKTVVAKRGAAIIEARKLSSAASAANATCDHVHDWFVGTKQGEFVSMAVMSSGQYGVAPGICFSFPVTCQNGNWKVVEGLKINDFSQQQINATQKELLEEKEMALAGFNKK